MTTDWTAPKNWGSETLTSTDMDTYVSDNTLHLYEKVPTGISPADRAGIAGAGTSEEWDTTATGLTWSPSAPTTVDSNTTWAGHLYMSVQADTTERLGTVSWSPTGAAAFDARMGGLKFGCSTSVASVVGQVGLHIGDSGNSNRLLLTVRYSLDTATTLLRAFTYASATYTQRGGDITVASSAPVYLRISRDGSNNCSFFWSLNGMLWNFIATQALTLTVTNIGVRTLGNATAAFQAAVDWMRTDV